MRRVLSIVARHVVAAIFGFALAVLVCVLTAFPKMLIELSIPVVAICLISLHWRWLLDSNEPHNAGRNESSERKPSRRIWTLRELARRFVERHFPDFSRFPFLRRQMKGTLLVLAKVATPLRLGNTTCPHVGTPRKPMSQTCTATTLSAKPETELRLERYAWMSMETGIFLLKRKKGAVSDVQPDCQRGGDQFSGRGIINSSATSNWPSIDSWQLSPSASTL